MTYDQNTKGDTITGILEAETDVVAQLTALVAKFSGSALIGNVKTVDANGVVYPADSTLPQEIVGSIADGGADTGKPVKVGGRYNSTLPTYTDGKRGDVQLGARGAQNTTLFAKDSPNAIGTGLPNADGVTPGTDIGLATRDYLHGFNGTNWDRIRLAGSTGALLTENGPYTASRKTADGQVKAGAGFIHLVAIAPLTAAPTAGLLTIYDSLTETGTIIYSEWIFATTPGHPVILDVAFSTGLFVGFDATLANVQATVSFR